MDALSVEQLTSTSDLARIRPDWDRCLEQAEAASVFVSWEWLSCWWRHYGAGRELRVLVAREGDRVVGLLPLYRERVTSARGMGARVLRLLGTGGDTSPDYLGPVVAAQYSRSVLPFLCKAAVSKRDWDVAELSDVADGSPFLETMALACAQTGAMVRTGEGARIVIVPLPSTWEDYLANLSSHRRMSVRRLRRRIEDSGGRLFVWTDPSTLDGAVDRLAELHRLRWAGRAEHHGFSSPEYVAFHRDVMHACMKRGWLRLMCLELEGTIAAMYYCYRFRDEVSHFQGGFDPRLEKHRPGQVLTAWAIQRAIDEGARVFDMLKGDYGHKQAWSDETRHTRSLRAYARNPRGLLLFLKRELLARLRRAADSAPVPKADPKPR